MSRAGYAALIESGHSPERHLDERTPGAPAWAVQQREVVAAGSELVDSQAGALISRNGFHQGKLAKERDVKVIRPGSDLPELVARSLIMIPSLCDIVFAAALVFESELNFIDVSRRYTPVQ